MSSIPQFQLKQNWPQVLLIVLATVGVVADAAGAFDAPPLLQMGAACALMLTAAWVRFYGHRWTFISSPLRAAAGITVAAALVFSLGVYDFIEADRSAHQSANLEVCGAAEDYSEAYVAAGTQWAATGLRTPETERADALAAENLDRLSRSANRSDNEDLKVIVHDVRMRASLGLAQNKTDAGNAAVNLQGSWTSLKVLISLCKKMGYPATEYARLPIEPSVERACQLLDQIVSMTSGGDARKWTSEQQKQFTALLNMFVYHGVNSSDEQFSAKALEFTKTINKDLGPTFDRLGPVYGSCVARGYDMKLADSVPREYVIH